MHPFHGVPRWIVALLLIDAALVAASVFNFLIGAPFSRITVLLHLDSETSLQAWYSSMQWLCAGVLMGAVSVHLLRAHGDGMLALLALAALCLIFSIDEIVGVHEWLGRKSDVLLPAGDRKATALWRTGIWPMLIGLPVLILIGALVLKLKRVFAGRTRAYRKLIVGLAVMFTGALAVELGVNLIDAGPGNAGLLLVQHSVEEFLEMIGVTLIVWSAYELCRSYGFELRAPSAQPSIVPATAAPAALQLAPRGGA